MLPFFLVGLPKRFNLAKDILLYSVIFGSLSPLIHYLYSKHHCRGCGKIFCSDCLLSIQLEQYNINDQVFGCFVCAAPCVGKEDDDSLPYLPTGGGELLLKMYNAGSSTEDIKVEWDGVPVTTAEFVKTKLGIRLRIPVGPGEGTHTVTITNSKRAKAPGKTLISYSPPVLLRVPSLKTEGGDLVIFGENLGSDDNQISITVDDEPCQHVHIKQEHKKVSCVTPPGVGIARINVNVAGQIGTYEALHDAPEILSVDPPDIDVTGGMVILQGRSFGFDENRIQILLKDFAVEATNIEVIEPHTSIRATFPAIPEDAEVGDALGIRVVVGGIFSITPATIVYCPPSGVAATATRPAYIPKRFGSAGRGPLAVPSPYANLFATDLPVEKRTNKSLSSTLSSSSLSGSTPGTPKGTTVDALSSKTPLKRHPSTVRVGGTLAGGGPTLSITPPTAWAPDSAQCDICSNKFGISLRRHHCRICGSCVCGPCSPHQLQLAPTKPPVRVCTRCNVRVGLLNQMTAVIDSIYTIRRLLPGDMFDTFQKEVLDAISAGNANAAVKAASAVGITSPLKNNFHPPTVMAIARATPSNTTTTGSSSVTTASTVYPPTNNRRSDSVESIVEVLVSSETGTEDVHPMVTLTSSTNNDEVVPHTPSVTEHRASITSMVGDDQTTPQRTNT